MPHKIRSLIGKRVKVIIDRPIGSKHPMWGFSYSLNYGFVQDIKGRDDEPLDAYLLGISEPLREYDGVCIAIIHRLDDEDKLVVVPEGKQFTDEQIIILTGFQERYFRSVILR